MDLNSSIVGSRLVAQTRAMAVVANNIANANTPGFKAQRVQFADWIAKQPAAGMPSGASTIAYTQDRATWSERQTGSLNHTGNTFDLALTGDGYFTVQTDRGMRLTRDGRFGLTATGTLADSNGNAVLDAVGQPISVPPTATGIAIAGDGTISGSTGQIGRLGVVRVGDPMRLKAEGGTLLDAPEGSTAADTAPGVVQGTLEESNVQPIMEMTRMLNETRQFQFAAQFLQAEADRQQGAIDKLLPGNGG